MTCAELRRYLSAFLDSELDPRTTVEVGAHLEACDDCAARVDSEANLERAIRDRLESAPVREEFWAETQARLDAPPPTPLRWGWALGWAASVAVALGLGWWVGHTPATPPKAPAAPAAGDGARDLIAVLRERGRELDRDGAKALHEYHAVAANAASAQAETRAFLARFVGHANADVARLIPHWGAQPAHPVELVGYGTAQVGGADVPVLHYRCCHHNLCVYFVVPAALNNFAGAAHTVGQFRQLTCTVCPTASVALRVCEQSGTVIAAVGRECASSFATAMAAP